MILLQLCAKNRSWLQWSQKLSEREESLQGPIRYAGAKPMSRSASAWGRNLTCGVVTMVTANGCLQCSADMLWRWRGVCFERLHLGTLFNTSLWKITNMLCFIQRGATNESRCLTLCNCPLEESLNMQCDTRQDIILFHQHQSPRWWGYSVRGRGRGRGSCYCNGTWSSTGSNHWEKSTECGWDSSLT